MRPQNIANSATSDNLQVEILKLPQSMQGTLKYVKSNKGNRNNINDLNNNNNSNNRNNNKNRNSNNNSNNYNANNSNNSSNSENFNNSNNSNNSNRRSFGNGRTDIFCWSHGACNRRSEDFFIRMTDTRIRQPWKTRCLVPQGLVLAAEMEDRMC